MLHANTVTRCFMDDFDFRNDFLHGNIETKLVENIGSVILNDDLKGDHIRNRMHGVLSRKIRRPAMTAFYSAIMECRPVQVDDFVERMKCTVGNTAKWHDPAEKVRQTEHIVFPSLDAAQREKPLTNFKELVIALKRAVAHAISLSVAVDEKKNGQINLGRFQRKELSDELYEVMPPPIKKLFYNQEAELDNPTHPFYHVVQENKRITQELAALDQMKIHPKKYFEGNNYQLPYYYSVAEVVVAVESKLGIVTKDSNKKLTKIITDLDVIFIRDKATSELLSRLDSNYVILNKNILYDEIKRILQIFITQYRTEIKVINPLTKLLAEKKAKPAAAAAKSDFFKDEPKAGQPIPRISTTPSSEGSGVLDASSSSDPVKQQP